MDPESKPKKPRRARRNFTEEFKVSAVRLVLDQGKSVSAAARDLDLTASALQAWVNQARADRSRGKTGLYGVPLAEVDTPREGNPRAGRVEGWS
jgi:transposase